MPRGRKPAAVTHNVIKEEVTRETRASTKARPRKRTSVDGRRDILTVYNKDPDYVYRWVEDRTENGQRIWRFKNMDYEFVTKGDGINVGDSYVYESADEGSIIRTPAKNGNFLYLMKIPRDWYNADQEAKQEAIDSTEKQILRPRDPENKEDDGQYGKNTLNYD